MKKSDDWEDMKVKRRRATKAIFESNAMQQISDSIDVLRREGKQIISDLDDNISGIDFNRRINQMDDVFDDIDEFKSEVINKDDIPEFVKETKRNAKQALNKDQDYTRRAKRRLSKINDTNRVKLSIRIMKLCDKAVDVNPSNYEAYYLKGRALINLGEYSRAIEEFIKSLAIKEDFTEAWISIADANRLNGELDDAISVYDKVLSEDENSFDALKGKAIVYFEINEYETASELFKKANDIQSLDDEDLKIWEKCKVN